jgi:hypothetical protein
VQRLTDRGINRLYVEPEHRADAGGHRGAEMGDMVDLVLVQTDPTDEVDLDFVGGGDTTDQVRTVDTELLGDRDQGGNVVAGMGVLGGQEGVVEVEFTHSHPVGPGRPLRRVAAVDPEHLGAVSGAVCQRLGAGDGDGPAGHRCRGHRGVVDDAVADHRFGLRRDRDRVGGDLPGQVMRGGESPRRCAVPGPRDQA